MSGVKEICQCLENSATGILIALQRRLGVIRAGELFWTLPIDAVELCLPSDSAQYPLVTEFAIVRDTSHWINVLNSSATLSGTSLKRAQYLYVKHGSIGAELRLHFNHNQEYLYTGTNEHLLALMHTMMAIKQMNILR